MHQSEEDIFPDEEDCQNIHQDADFFSISREGIHDGVGDDAKRDAFGDAVCERHGKDGDICGNGFGGVAEVNARDSGEHEEAHDDKGGGGGKCGNRQEERREEEGEGKKDGYGDSGKTGSSAFRNACRAFYKGGCRGNPEACADGGGDSVRHESAFDAGQLPFVIKHICFGGNADQGAEGIKNIHEEEGKKDDEEVGSHHFREIKLHENGGKAYRGKRGNACGKIWKGAECAFCGIGDVEPREFAEDAESPCEEDTPENISSHFFHHEDACKKNTQDSEENRNSHGVECACGNCSFKGKKRNFCSRIGNDDIGGTQSDESDEQTDACRHCPFQVDRDCVENRFAHIGKRQDNENHAFQTNGGESGLPGIAHLSDDSEREERIQPHAGSEGEGVIGKECHKDSTDEGSEGGRCKKRAFVHAGGAHDAGVDCQDIRHRHESRDARHDFCPDGRVIFLQVKNSVQKTGLLFHKISPFSFIHNMYHYKIFTGWGQCVFFFQCIIR